MTGTAVALESAEALSSALGEGLTTSVDIVRQCIATIDRLNPLLGAVVHVDRGAALAAAQASDERRARGLARGPLDGIPATVKDTHDIAGQPTTDGHAAFATRVAAHDSEVVARLRDAGVVLLGKTNLPAFSKDGQTWNELFGLTRNPWDLERTAGGSSGGSAVAVATGMAAFDLGADMGGSVRTPAAWNGVFGHKPTWGLVPQTRDPLRPENSGLPLDTAIDIGATGLVARAAGDLALIMHVLVGPLAPDRRAWTATLPPPRVRDASDLVVSVLLDDPFVPTSRETRRVLEEGLAALRARGVTIVEKPLPRPVPALCELFETLSFIGLSGTMPEAAWRERIASLEAEAEAETESESGLGGVGWLWKLHARAAGMTHREWLRLDESRRRLREEWDDYFSDVHALVTPVAPVQAHPHDLDRPPLERRYDNDGVLRPNLPDLRVWPGITGVAYLPSTIAPVGLDDAGLPVGAQVAAAECDDLTAIHVAGLLAEAAGGGSAPPLVDEPIRSASVK
ncbi:amidase [Pseudoclavibacter endophyticus]|uniref:amidase family protein n=1 Tax=Pseudoclavibacter endophyticus TaxID=1778590 RepID=UPI00166573D3|nr:amidase family protein [Pseudoclavibacter endophyticus]GGA63079.1 amidase [Pseudoclavibacter endophyticus]